MASAGNINITIMGLVKEKSVELDHFFIKSYDWLTIKQIIAAILEHGTWTNGIDVDIIERVYVFIHEPPDSLKEEIKGLPVKEFAPNPPNWENGWHFIFSKVMKKVDLYKFFNQAHIIGAALSKIFQMEQAKEALLTSKEISNGLTEEFQVFHHRGGSRAGMSQVINQWVKQGYLKRGGVYGSRLYWVDQEKLIK